MSFTDSKTHQNLKAAFAGESQANRRYTWMAQVAEKEGLPEVAGLFKHSADGETGHALKHLMFLAAQAFWRDLVRRFPDILGRREPLVIRFQQNGTVFWRLRTDGFQSVEDAQSLCAQVRASGQNCFVVRS